MERSDTEDEAGERGDKSQNTNHDGDKSSKVRYILSKNLKAFLQKYFILMPRFVLH